MIIKYAIEQLTEQLAAKEKELSSLKKEIEWVHRATFYYPDVVQRQDRWKNISYASRFVNEVAEDFEYKRTCGCCADAPHEVIPYLNFEGRRIYASCGGIVIKRNRYYGSGKFVSDWKERLVKNNISKYVIDKASSMISPDDVEEADSNDL